MEISTVLLFGCGENFSMHNFIDPENHMKI